jgi:uncharacterized membrane protein YesL
MDEVTLLTPKKPFIRRNILITMGAAVLAALTCFVAVAFLPATERALFDDPLRSFLTGFGVIGVAYPLCVVGLAMKKRWESSPYFEGSFIAAVMNLFGFAAVAVGLVCIAFGVYGLVVRFLDST